MVDLTKDEMETLDHLLEKVRDSYSGGSPSWFTANEIMRWLECNNVNEVKPPWPIYWETIVIR